MIIATDAGKPLAKIQHAFMKTIPRKCRTRGNISQIIKTTYKEPITNILK